MENTNRSWLQRLKDESWEAELLISTVAILGIFQLFKLADGSTTFIINQFSPAQYWIGHGIVTGGILAFSILATMFVIHFLLRAYWVGLVGLNSVFPDYSIEDSAYSELYTEKILALLPKLKKTIKDVDELCSVIFSAAFFMMFLYVYLSLFTLIYLIAFNSLSDHIHKYILFLPIAIISAVGILQTILSVLANIRVLKKSRRIQTLYFQSVKWGSILLFGPLYKFLLQISMTFGSNFKKKKAIVILLLVFAVVGIFSSGFKVDNTQNLAYLQSRTDEIDATRIQNGFYESRTENNLFLVTPQIESDIINREIHRLFIPIYKHERRKLKRVCAGDVDKLEKHSDKSKWYLNCYAHYHEVCLDDEKVDATYLKYELPVTGQFGIVTYIDMGNKPKGLYTLRVKKNMKDSLRWEIPFHYLPKH